MTLTSLLPTLRDSLPSPMARDLWPAHTVATTNDIVIAGISLLRYIDLCSTPSVTTGPSIIRLSGGMPSPTETTTVLMVSVVALGEDDPTSLAVDAALDAVAPCWSEARLIGRVSHARDSAYTLRDGCGRPVPGARVILPGDVAVGDLIAVPFAGAVSVGAVRVEADDVRVAAGAR